MCGCRSMDQPSSDVESTFDCWTDTMAAVSMHAFLHACRKP
jgi:hypothetical protein